MKPASPKTTAAAATTTATQKLYTRNYGATTQHAAAAEEWMGKPINPQGGGEQTNTWSWNLTNFYFTSEAKFFRN